MSPDAPACDGGCHKLATKWVYPDHSTTLGGECAPGHRITADYHSSVCLALSTEVRLSKIEMMQLVEGVRGYIKSCTSDEWVRE